MKGEHVEKIREVLQGLDDPGTKPVIAQKGISASEHDATVRVGGVMHGNIPKYAIYAKCAKKISSRCHLVKKKMNGIHFFVGH
jgi:6,7-dimethyl-8-ribityllumazine synthase